jgi:hypothetical protein
MSTMNAPEPRSQGLLAPLWDRLSGVPVLGRLADEETRLRLASGLAGLSTRPNQAVIDNSQSRLEEIATQERINLTVNWLNSIGRSDLAEAVAAGSLMGDQAAAIAMQPPEPPPAPIEINGQLVDPTTGQVIGDYRTQETASREIRTDQNGVDRYVDTGEPVFPNVTAPAGPELNPDQLSAANALRDDLNNQLQPFTLARDGYQNVQTFFNNPGAVSDKALAVAFAKILDPSSVVREGESAAIAGATSIPSALQAQLLAAINGTGELPPEVRQEIANLATQLYQTRATEAEGILSNYRGLAERAGLPFESVYLGTGVQQPAAAVPALPPALLQNQTFTSLAQRRNMTPEEYWQGLSEELRQSMLENFGGTD